MPVTGYPVTQWYGEHPENYERFGLPGHEGLDFGCPVGTPVLCSADGVVVTCRTVPGNHPYGKFIRVWHEELGLLTVYAHLSHIDKAVGRHVAVKRGQELGLSGNTGNSRGPHLHYSVRVKRDEYLDGPIIDPRPLLEWEGAP